MQQSKFAFPLTGLCMVVFTMGVHRLECKEINRMLSIGCKIKIAQSP